MAARAAPGSVVFLSAVRTPFGTFGGKLKDFSPVDLAVHASRAAIERAGISATDVDQTIFGNVLYTTKDSIYFARHVALKSGCRQETSALTLNRLCGSGFQAVVSGAQEIILGDAQLCLVGGAESMSQAPHVTRGLRWGTPLGRAPVMEDVLWEGLTDSYVGLGMAETAENLAERYKLDRGCVDEFALRSQQLSKAAWDAGVFDDEVVPVPISNPKTGKVEELAKDEHMRPDTTAEKLAALKPAFRKGGVVTAGNASGIGDGAAAACDCRRSICPRPRAQAVGAPGLVGSRRCRSRGHGHRTGARLEGRAGQGRSLDGRHGSDRGERSLCRADLRRRTRALAPEREIERARRSDCVESSACRVGSEDHGPSTACVACTGKTLRPGNRVHRRRPGHSRCS